MTGRKYLADSGFDAETISRARRKTTKANECSRYLADSGFDINLVRLRKMTNHIRKDGDGHPSVANSGFDKSVVGLRAQRSHALKKQRESSCKVDSEVNTALESLLEMGTVDFEHRLQVAKVRKPSSDSDSYLSAGLSALSDSNSDAGDSSANTPADSAVAHALYANNAMGLLPKNARETRPSWADLSGLSDDDETQQVRKDIRAQPRQISVYDALPLPENDNKEIVTISSDSLVGDKGSGSSSCHAPIRKRSSFDEIRSGEATVLLSQGLRDLSQTYAQMVLPVVLFYT